MLRSPAMKQKAAYLGLQIGQELKDKCQKRAEEERRKLSDWVRLVLEKAVKAVR